MGNANNSFSVVDPLFAGALNRISQDVDMVTVRGNYRFGGPVVMVPRIEDFGSAGSLVVIGAAGFLASVAYRRVVTGHTTWLAALTLTYAFLFTSMALSPFAYMGPAIAGATFVMYILFAARPHGASRAIFAGLSSRSVPDRIGA